MLENIRKLFLTTPIEKRVEEAIELKKSIEDNILKAQESASGFSPLIDSLSRNVESMEKYCELEKSDYVKQAEGLILLDKIKDKLAIAQSEYFKEIGELRKSNNEFESKLAVLRKDKELDKVLYNIEQNNTLNKEFEVITDSFKKGLIPKEMFLKAVGNYHLRLNESKQPQELKKSILGEYGDKVIEVIKGLLKKTKEPTEAQKEAGNYKKEKVKVRGLTVSIENKKGSVRYGKNKDGEKWEVKMNNDYGYFNRTQGKDGDHIDVFFSDKPDNGDIFVIDQLKEDGSFDEHKVMMGFSNKVEAVKSYRSNYNKGKVPKLKAITKISEEDLKKWLGVENGGKEKKNKPYSEIEEVDIEKSLKNVQDAINSGILSEDILEKAKYIRREGTAGNYKYIYNESELKENKQGTIDITKDSKKYWEEKWDKKTREKNKEQLRQDEIYDGLMKMYIENKDKNKVLSSIKFWLNKNKDNKDVEVPKIKAIRKFLNEYKFTSITEEDLFKNVSIDIKKSIETVKQAYKDGLISKEILLKSINNYLEKGRSGVYSDNPTNKRLNRVGQKYGSSKQEDSPEVKKTTKEEDKTDNKNQPIEEQAKNVSGSALETASKEASDPEVRVAAKKELTRREKEESGEDESEQPEKESVETDNKSSDKNTDSSKKEEKPVEKSIENDILIKNDYTKWL